MSDFNFNNVVPVSVLEEKTVKELRAMCAELELSKYSKAAKPVLVQMLSDFYNDSLMEMTAKELRAICADRGITGVAKTNKANLIKLLFESLDVEKLTATEDEVSVEEIVDISSDDDEIVEESSAGSGTVTVINGARSRTIPFEEGKTVWDIHQQMANEMGIAAHPSFMVNDTDAPNNVIIREGDTIEFFKVSGTKGVIIGTLLEKC